MLLSQLKTAETIKYYTRLSRKYIYLLSMIVYATAATQQKSFEGKDTDAAAVIGSPALLGFICCKLYSHESMHAVSHVSDLQQKKCAPDTHLSPKLETLLGILRTVEHKVYIQGMQKP